MNTRFSRMWVYLTDPRRRMGFALFLAVLIVYTVRLNHQESLSVLPHADEYTYIRAARNYIDHLTRFDLWEIVSDRKNAIHPLWGKISYALVLLGTCAPDQAEIGEQDALMGCRLFNFTLGVLTTIPLFLVGGVVSLGVWAGSRPLLDYTSLCYLEGQVCFYSVLAIYCFSRYRQRHDRWWLLAVVLGGAAVAVKYSALLIVAALSLTVFVWCRKRRWLQTFVFIFETLAVFLLLNPRLLLEPFVPFQVVDRMQAYFRWAGIETLDLEHYYRWQLFNTKDTLLQDGHIYLAGLLAGVIALSFRRLRSQRSIFVLLLAALFSCASLLLFPIYWRQYTVLPLLTVGLFAGAVVKSVNRTEAKLVATRTALLLFGISLSLLLAEGLVRVTGLAPKYSIIQTNLPYADFVTSPDPILRYVPKPGRSEINASGYRGPEVSQEKPANVWRIVVLGDSISFGWLVSVVTGSCYLRFCG